MRFKGLPFSFAGKSVHFGSGWRIFSWLMLALLGAGCATVAPVEEARLFSKAFTAVDGVSQPLLDDLAMAERRWGQDNATLKAKKDMYTGPCEGIRWAEPGFIEGLCIDDAPYFSEIGDPPATHAFRRAVRLVGEYSEVLLTFAEGRNLDDTTGQVESLGRNIAALVALIPNAGPTGVAITGALGALQPIIRDAAQSRNVKEMKRLVLDGAPQVRLLIQALRQAAPGVFKTLVYQSLKKVRSPEALTNDAQAKVHLDRILAYRVAVSNYLVLLSELEQAFDELVAAFRKPRSNASLSSLAQRSARLAGYAEASRKVYTILRTGSE